MFFFFFIWYYFCLVAFGRVDVREFYNVIVAVCLVHWGLLYEVKSHFHLPLTDNFVPDRLLLFFYWTFLKGRNCDSQRVKFSTVENSRGLTLRQKMVLWDFQCSSKTARIKRVRSIHQRNMLPRMVWWDKNEQLCVTWIDFLWSVHKKQLGKK